MRKEQVDALARSWQSYLGTSHRQKTVKSQVGRLRAGLAELFSLPEGYEVVLGNGGSTAFWDVATFGLVRDRAQFLSFGEFGAKFASGVKKAPHLGEPTILKAEPGAAPAFAAEAGIDAYCSPHNETSTGVALTPAARRRRRRRRPRHHRRHQRRGRPRGRRDASSTPTTSRRRSASAPTAACGSR